MFPFFFVKDHRDYISASPIPVVQWQKIVIWFSFIIVCYSSILTLLLWLGMEFLNFKYFQICTMISSLAYEFLKFFLNFQMWGF